jgi:radical SAM protein with 4Fe4S-binding SPASM domain
MLQKKGIYVVVATNCLLADTMPDSLFMDIDYMVLDVDAVDKEHYERVRLGGNYETMIENVERILEIRKGSKKYTVVQFIDYESPDEDKREFMRKYAKKADEVRVKFLDTFAGQAFEGKPQSGVCCLEPLYGVSIWSNGDVVMCDRDINAVNVLGNVRRSSLLSIWNNEVVRRTQEAHMGKQGERLKPCDCCEEWRLTNLRNVPELTVNMFKGGFV